MQIFGSCQCDIDALRTSNKLHPVRWFRVDVLAKPLNAELGLKADAYGTSLEDVYRFFLVPELTELAVRIIEI